MGPLADAYRALGVPEAELDRVVAERHAYARRTLLPRDGVVSTLEELRRRRFRLGLVSACSEDVAVVWPDTPFSGLFDGEVFSATCGYMKPDPEIFLLTAERVGVEAGECLFVGDGANDELSGAERAGMTAVQLRAPGEALTRDGEAWQGASIEHLSEVVDLT